jgi:hypothetical protein
MSRTRPRKSSSIPARNFGNLPVSSSGVLSLKLFKRLQVLSQEVNSLLKLIVRPSPPPSAGLMIDHLITWLARVVSNAGVEPGSPASEALPVLQKWTGGHAFDPVIGKYWE